MSPGGGVPLYEVLSDGRAEKANQCFEPVFYGTFRTRVLQVSGKASRTFKAGKTGV